MKQINFFIILASFYYSLSAWGASQCQVYETTSFHKDLLNYSPKKAFRKECIRYGLNSMLSLNASLAQCQDQDGSAISGKPKLRALPPCLDDQSYVDITYQSIQIVAECLDIPVKEILPKIKGESGFLHNAIGKDFDAGIGQLTANAIKDAQSELPSIKLLITSKASKNNACQILLSKWSQLSSITSTGINNRCEFLSWPLNPLKNIFWTGVFLKRLSHLTTLEMESREIRKKMITAGLSDEDYVNMQGLITNLSYNSGSRSAVIHLNNYLNKKNKLNQSLSKRDFNFKENLYNVGPDLPFSETTFPAYIKIHMGSGYLSGMMKQIYDYNNNVGPHQCSPEFIEGFLAL